MRCMDENACMNNDDSDNGHPHIHTVGIPGSIPISGNNELNYSQFPGALADVTNSSWLQYLSPETLPRPCLAQKADTFSVTESSWSSSDKPFPSLHNLDLPPPPPFWHPLGSQSIIKENANCLLIDNRKSISFKSESSHNDDSVYEKEVSIENNSEVSQDPRRSNYVYQILSSSYEGEFMIAAYDFELDEDNRRKLEETKKTTYFSKNKVAKLVINHEFYRTNCYHIPSARLDELAGETSKLFPIYFKESFYTKSTQNKGPAGAFQVYYGKQREKEIAIGRLNPSAGKRKRAAEEETEEFEGFQDLQTPVNIIDEDYKKKWCSLALKERLEFYRKTQFSIIFEKFVNLKNPLGYTLVQADFEAIYGTPADLFQKNWPSLSDKVLKLAKKKKAADTNIKEILNDNRQIRDEVHKQTLALVLLPYLFKRVPKQTSRSKNKTTWVPEKSDVAKTFILHIKATENFKDALQDAQKELVDFHNDHKVKIQPFVVINGPSLNDIKSAYVILDQEIYQVNTSGLAVDLCFKCCKIFRESFSVISNHVWQFLEKEVYETEVKDLYGIVATVIENLRKL